MKQPTPTQLRRTTELVQQGLTTSQVQRELQREHIGYRRTIMLAYIRVIRNIRSIGIYGTVNGQSRRIQLKGTKTQLGQAIRHAIKNPPQQQFLTKKADAYLRAIKKRQEQLTHMQHVDPNKYTRWLEEHAFEEWDTRPNLES